MSGGLWVASYIALWAAVVLLGLTVVVLLRQIGVLHARLQPMGVHFAGEGPELDGRAPAAGPFEYSAPMTLVAFTSSTCDICEALRPGLRSIERSYDDVELVEIESSDATRSTFRAFNVSNTPYFVAVDAEGIVRGRGIANTLDQIEELLREALDSSPAVDL
ncbi:MAG: thioredoxin domain-containing protein [Actinomycetota bacterium]